MRIVGECSTPVIRSGIAKVLITANSHRSPEYVLINVHEEHMDFDHDRPVEVIIRNVEP